MESYDAPSMTAVSELPLALQQAALAAATVLTRGSEPGDVVLLFEFDYDPG